MAKPGNVVKVENVTRSGSECPTYFAAWVSVDGTATPLMITPRELKVYARGTSSGIQGIVTRDNIEQWCAFAAVMEEDGKELVLSPTEHAFSVMKKRGERELALMPKFEAFSLEEVEEMEELLVPECTCEAVEEEPEEQEVEETTVLEEKPKKEESKSLFSWICGFFK